VLDTLTLQKGTGNNWKVLEGAGFPQLLDART